jgi:hypothetical protein
MGQNSMQIVGQDSMQINTAAPFSLKNSFLLDRCPVKHYVFLLGRFAIELAFIEQIEVFPGLTAARAER